MLPLVLVTLTLPFRQIGVEPGDRHVRTVSALTLPMCVPFSATVGGSGVRISSGAPSNKINNLNGRLAALAALVSGNLPVLMRPLRTAQTPTTIINPAKQWASDISTARNRTVPMRCASAPSRVQEPQGRSGVARMLGALDRSGLAIRRGHQSASLPEEGTKVVRLAVAAAHGGWIANDIAARQLHRATNY